MKSWREFSWGFVAAAAIWAGHTALINWLEEQEKPAAVIQQGIEMKSNERVLDLRCYKINRKGKK